MSQVILANAKNKVTPPPPSSDAATPIPLQRERIADFFNSPTAPYRGADALRMRQALRKLFETNRAEFNVFFREGGNFGPELERATQYKEIETKIEQECSFIFEAVRSGKIIYIWLEGRTFPADTKSDEKHIEEIFKKDEKKFSFLKEFNRILINVAASAEVNNPLPFDEEKTKARLDKLQVTFNRVFTRKEPKEELEICIDAVMKRQLNMEWPIDDNLPFVLRVLDRKAMNVFTFDACRNTEEALKILRRKRDGIPDSMTREATTRSFSRVLALLNQLRVKNPKALKSISYEHGVLFETAVLESQIQFDWAEGKEHPVRFRYEGDFLSTLTSDQKKALDKILALLVPKEAAPNKKR